jgi:SAM-dependent methyltransferase
MANEAGKVREYVLSILGPSNHNGLDLGCGPFKIMANCVGVDSGGYEGVVNSPVLDFLRSQNPGQYDWVFSSHFLEHEPKIIEVLKEIERVLKPGALLLLYLPDRRLYVNAQGQDPNVTHVNHWTPGEFADLLLDNTCMRLVELRRRNSLPDGHRFTGDGSTEDPRVNEWEYSFFVLAELPDIRSSVNEADRIRAVDRGRADVIFTGPYDRLSGRPRSAR